MPFTTQKLQKWTTQKQMTEELQKRSTAFHKAVLPTFTKQLRKNYTIIPQSGDMQIYPQFSFLQNISREFEKICKKTKKGRHQRSLWRSKCFATYTLK